MKTITKRLFSGSLAVFLTVSSVLYPARESKAFGQFLAAPAAASAARVILTSPAATRAISAAAAATGAAAVTTATANGLAAASAVSVGASTLTGWEVGALLAVGAMGIQASKAIIQNPDGSTPVVIHLDPHESDYLVPGTTSLYTDGSGATYPTPVSSYPAAASTYVNACNWNYYPSGTWGTPSCAFGVSVTPDNVASLTLTKFNGSPYYFQWKSVQVTSPGVMSITDKNNNTVQAFFTYSTATQYSCATGYTLSGSNCMLTNAAAVTKTNDGKAEIRRNADGSWIQNPRDTDPLPSNFVISTDGKKLTYVDPNNSKIVTITSNADGTTSISESTIGTYDGSPATKQKEIQISAADTNATPTAANPETKPSAIVGGKEEIKSGIGTASSNVAVPVTSVPSSSTTVNIDTSSLADKATQTQILNNENSQTASLAKIESAVNANTAVPSNINLNLPTVPNTFWSRRYPDGLVGVWQSKQAALLATPMMASLQAFVPNFSGSSACPSFTFDMSGFPVFGSTWGQKVISPPCWFMEALKVLFSISILFACRRIIFGG